MVTCQRCVKKYAKVVPAVAVVAVHLSHGHRQEVLCEDHVADAVNAYGLGEVEVARLQAPCSEEVERLRAMGGAYYGPADPDVIIGPF